MSLGKLLSSYLSSRFESVFAWVNKGSWKKILCDNCSRLVLSSDRNRMDGKALNCSMALCIKRNSLLEWDYMKCFVKNINYCEFVISRNKRLLFFVNIWRNIINQFRPSRFTAKHGWGWPIYFFQFSLIYLFVCRSIFYS